MELKEGMYVRTEKGKITKIDRKVDDITNYYFGCFECDNYINVNGDEFISEYEILKASYNIIDLIEEGDYVNGYPVKCHFGSNAVCLDINYQKHGIEQIVEDQEIKTIVTKEQFESMKYSLEA